MGPRIWDLDFGKRLWLSAWQRTKSGESETLAENRNLAATWPRGGGGWRWYGGLLDWWRVKGERQAVWQHFSTPR